jgi:hypothetical protein
VRHSATEFPSEAFCWGKETVVSAEDKIRKPDDPVSTKTPSTVWQVDVPGEHTVTLVKAPLA